jgi:uncharacterized membrane protein YjfL (UPF0719 family)
MMIHVFGLLHGAVYSGIILAFIYIAKLLEDRRTTCDDDHEIIVNNNTAISWRRAGLYLGIAIGMAGAASGNGKYDFLKDVVMLCIDGAIIIPLFFSARYINDKFILSCIDNDCAIDDKNDAVGIAEFGSYVTSGLIINGSFSGDGKDLMTNIVSSVVFFLIGQIYLVCFVKYYQASKARKYKGQAEFHEMEYDLIKEIKAKNISAGVALVGSMIAFGFILRASIAGSFVDWLTDLSSFVSCALIGTILIMILRKVLDLIILRGTNQYNEVVLKKFAASMIIREALIISLGIGIGAVI